MNLKEYFEMGRKQEIEYERKQKARTVIKSNKKPSPYSIAGILIGAGVFYQIISPTVNKLLPIASSMRVAVRDNLIKRTFDVMITDLKMLKMRICGINPDWEKYKQFDELARK
jgi:hypothetical protein